MNNVTFLHLNTTHQNQDGMSNNKKRRRRSRTVAVQPLSYDDVIKVAQSVLSISSESGFSLSMLIGIAYLNPEDKNYIRALGRTEAVKNPQKVSIKVKSVKVSDTHIHVELEKYADVLLTLRVNRLSKKSTVFGTLAE